MNIYNDYLNTIEAAMKNGSINESFTGLSNNLRKSFSNNELLAKTNEKRLLPSLNELAQELSLNPNFDQQLGLHPDFSHLKNTGDTENHYIVSVFIDIKGSTNLFRKYDAETVFVISNTIQKAAIHTCLLFGGYIHRLQGDGLFVYFGGKESSIEDSVRKSLQCASAFTYFVQNDLKNLFDQQGIEKISTRIGIDLGLEHDVVWANAGIGEISEVTTCSLHTSLASKMQASAESNGIVIGDNIKEHATSIHDLVTPVCHRTDKETDRYIFEIPHKGFRYTQYDFSWLKFLKRQDFIATDFNGNLSLKKRKETQTRVLDDIAPIAATNKPYFHFL
ncbi:MAG: adenylate/guanylate cyclase domain-containing protein [Reichenbachiella sp.]